MTTERHLGEKIRQLREQQQMSTEVLATQSQLSEAFIVQVESGKSLPSLAPLMKLSRALGIRLGTFLDEEAYSGPVLVRNGTADEVVRFSGSESSGRDALDFYSLASHKKDRHMEPFLIKVHPGEQHTPHLSSHEGEEFIYILEGTIDVSYGKDTFTLNAGDSRDITKSCGRTGKSVHLLILLCQAAFCMIPSL